MAECECSLRGSILGDGCSVCNPAQALEYAEERLVDQAVYIAKLRGVLQEIRAEAGSHTVALHIKPQRGSGMSYVFDLADKALSDSLMASSSKEST